MSEYDLVLIVGYFRSAMAYLSIVRGLSRDWKIAVVITDADHALRDKTGDARAVFIELCRKFGAEIVDHDTPVRARVAVVQQFPYDDALAAALQRSVTASRWIGLNALAMAGLETHDKFLKQFPIARLFVPSRRFTEFLLERRGAAKRYADLQMEEVGLPYRQHPVFPEVGIDWLIAAPTLFSFSTERGKHDFLETVLQLLGQMDSADVVAYKPHNGNMRDYFAPRAYYAAAAIVRKLPGGESLLRALIRVTPAAVRAPLERVLTGFLHQRILSRAVPLVTITPYADMGLEAFLPGVRKGVIGGLSNTIWGTLYFGLPFYNCVRPDMVRHDASELLNKNATTLLGLNLQYFGVPYCEGRLSGGARGETIVGDDDRRGDLILALRREMEAAA